MIEANKATLFFTNSRHLAEKITLEINDDQLAPLAYAHHGSLARDIRTEVESRLKAGELRGIVATNSLEMGIDIGHLDEVVMIQSPRSVASTLQRIGRAGHQVRETSVGTLYPTHAQDFLEAAALTQAVNERDIEPLTPLTNALDALAQIIVSCCANETWEVDALYALLKRSAPYANLPRTQFDLVIEMLSGRYSGSRVRELKPRQPIDPARLLMLVNPDNLRTLLRRSLEQSGFFGARFRECAGRSLLLTRQRFNQRLPLWMSRLQAKNLMTAVKDYSDFPVLLETWRTCLLDEFNLTALEQMLSEIQEGRIAWSFVTTATPSPFASNITFGQISRYMYADDSPEQANARSLSDELIANAIADEALRPKIERQTIDEFLRKRQPRTPDYQPMTTGSNESRNGSSFRTRN